MLKELSGTAAKRRAICYSRVVYLADPQICIDLQQTYSSSQRITSSGKHLIGRESATV